MKDKPRPPTGSVVRRVRMFACAICHALVGTAILAPPRAAVAQNASVPDQAASESLFQNALDLWNGGHVHEACLKLEESQRLDPGAIGGMLYLAGCYRAEGRLATAWVTFQSAADAARRAGDQDRVRKAEEQVRQLEKTVPKLTVVVPSEARIPGLEIRRDQLLVTEAAWDVKTAVDPGSYTVMATAPEHEPWSTRVTLQPAGSFVVRVPALRPLPFWTTWQQHWLALGAAGAGIVGIAVGAGFGLQAKSKEKDSEKDCRPYALTLCNPDGVAKLEDARRAATIANIGFIAGGVFLAGAVALYVTAQPRTERPVSAPQFGLSIIKSGELASLRAAPVLGVETQGLAVEGAF